jgi:hypothetical protein
MAVLRYRDRSDDGVEDQEHDIAHVAGFSHKLRHVGCRVEWPDFPAGFLLLADNPHARQVSAHPRQAGDDGVRNAVL